MESQKEKENQRQIRIRDPGHDVPVNEDPIHEAGEEVDAGVPQGVIPSALGEEGPFSADAEVIPSSNEDKSFDSDEEGSWISAEDDEESYWTSEEYPSDLDENSSHSGEVQLGSKPGSDAQAMASLSPHLSEDDLASNSRAGHQAQLVEASAEQTPGPNGGTGGGGSILGLNGGTCGGGPNTLDPNGRTGGGGSALDPNGGTCGGGSNTPDPNERTGGGGSVLDPNGGTCGGGSNTPDPNGRTGGGGSSLDPNGGTCGGGSDTPDPNGWTGGRGSALDPNGGTCGGGSNTLGLNGCAGGGGSNQDPNDSTCGGRPNPELNSGTSGGGPILSLNGGTAREGRLPKGGKTFQWKFWRLFGRKKKGNSGEERPKTAEPQVKRFGISLLGQSFRSTESSGVVLPVSRENTSHEIETSVANPHPEYGNSGRESKTADKEAKSGKWSFFGRKHRRVKPLETLLPPRPVSDPPTCPFSREDFGQSGILHTVSDARRNDLIKTNPNVAPQEDDPRPNSNDKPSLLGRLRGRVTGTFKNIKRSKGIGDRPAQSVSPNSAVDSGGHTPSSMTLPDNISEDRPVLKRMFSSIHFRVSGKSDPNSGKVIKWGELPIPELPKVKPGKIRSRISTDTMSLSDFPSQEDRPRLKRIFSSIHGPLVGSSGKSDPKSKQGGKDGKKSFWEKRGQKSSKSDKSSTSSSSSSSPK